MYTLTPSSATTCCSMWGFPGPFWFKSESATGLFSQPKIRPLIDPLIWLRVRSLSPLRQTLNKRFAPFPYAEQSGLIAWPLPTAIASNMTLDLSEVKIHQISIQHFSTMGILATHESKNTIRLSGSRRISGSTSQRACGNSIPAWTVNFDGSSF